MGGNTFGKLFTITTAGESHGPGLGVIIDGCPPGIQLDKTYLQSELDRRRPGQSDLTTQRKEKDQPDILSGVYDGLTTGAPILVIIPNEDHRSADYNHLETAFRPSHADYTYYVKYGIRDHRGGGRSSARETVNWVIGGAIAKRFLAAAGIHIQAGVTSVHQHHSAKSIDQLDFINAEKNKVRSADPEMTELFIHSIEKARDAGDTVGGVVTCLITGCPAGLGEPVFSKIEADLARAMLNINATKGFEIGSGFRGAAMRGSEHNDVWEKEGDQFVTQTNHSGGVQGGITNGMPVYFRVAFKPVSTIQQQQVSVNQDGDTIRIEGKGRHDPCVVPRAVAIVEAMAALVIADHLLLANAARAHGI